MKLTHDLENLLVRMKNILPPENREQFARNIRLHFEKLALDDLAGCTIAGALLGSAAELLPLDVITGVDDWVEIGATLGAWVGYARSSKERQLRREIQRIIDEEVRSALAASHFRSYINVHRFLGTFQGFFSPRARVHAPSLQGIEILLPELKWYNCHFGLQQHAR